MPDRSEAAVPTRDAQALTSDATPQGDPYKIRWVLAHEPVSVFEPAAKRFCEIVRQETKDKVETRLYTKSQYAQSLGKKSLAPGVILRMVMNGQLEMNQTYTPTLGQSSYMLWALDLPFLFRDHEHAAKVLDGPIGQKLMEELLPFGLRGLAFTYSGGFRIVATTGPELRRWEDFQGLRVRTSQSPVAIKLLESLGAKPVPARLEDIISKTEKDEINAAETTYPRYWALGQNQFLKTVNETYHSLFLTMIVVNERFYQGLPQSYQAVLRNTARHVATMERAHSIEDGRRVRQMCLESGIKVVPMPENEKERFAGKTSEMHERFSPLFGKDLLDGIRKA